MGVSVLTQHNDNQRTGVNSGEPGLTPDAVRSHFRRLTELQIDGQNVETGAGDVIRKTTNDIWKSQSGTVTSN